jgi:tRNA modification GTPase
MRGNELGGIPLTVVDTAGLRDTADAVERIGIARTESAMARADLALVIVDARDTAATLPQEDAAVLGRLPPALPRIVVHNKSDLAGVPAHVERLGGAAGGADAGELGNAVVAHVWLSALTGEGLGTLEGVMLDAAGVAATPDDALMARERHLAALRDADAHLAAANAHLFALAPPLELVAEELRAAQESLSTITGEFTADDLLGAIFSRFCIGK